MTSRGPQAAGTGASAGSPVPSRTGSAASRCPAIPKAKTPGLADLDGLVAAFRESGLDVELDLPAELPQLSAGVDVSAYRIVQEALTNALRYGSDRTAHLRLVTTPTSLSIEATNPSSGSDGVPGSGSGPGLLGMAERAHLVGGRLSHGGRDGRFELTASLPVGP